jgi:hypothetical protein
VLHIDGKFKQQTASSKDNPAMPYSKESAVNPTKAPLAMVLIWLESKRLRRQPSREQAQSRATPCASTHFALTPTAVTNQYRHLPSLHPHVFVFFLIRPGLFVFCPGYTLTLAYHALV